MRITSTETVIIPAKPSVFCDETLYCEPAKTHKKRAIIVGKRTPFYDFHVKTNAKIVDFAGWDMPLHYGSQLEEHHQVRQHAGIFDVSHMGVVDLLGSDVKIYLERLLANDVNKLANGKALYTCMLNEQGGVLDDLIVYKINDDFYRVIVNAGTRQKDIAWMREQTHGLDINILERVDDAMFAVQGPEVKNIIDEIFLPEQSEALKALKPFNFLITNDTFIARTGYTGEDGYEIITSEKNAVNLWESFVKAGVKPCGLGSRDTLRLEAGLNLYGSDMDESVTPLESNLAWTVTLEPQSRDFIGRKALEKIKDEGVKQRLVGLVLEGPGIIRNHQRVLIKGNGEGVVTSGGYSPTLEKSIALARIPNETEGELFVEIRNKQIPAKVIKPPFVRNGKKLV